MAAPFTVTSVSNYNSNPPSDDGSQTSANRVQWSTQKSKLSDPIKTAFDSSETNTSTAFGKVVGGAGFTSTAVDYTVSASDQGKIIKCTVSGKTITTPDATSVGSPFVFCVLNNSSGDITFKGNGTQTIDGLASFTIPAGCGCMANTDGTNWFTDGQNFNNVLQRPQGYLTLTSLTPIITGDVSAATAVYYTPYDGDRIPITVDGASFKMRQFSELTLTLVANHLASTLYDVFVFDNSGTTTIGTGPAWNTNTAGSCARGTGAGTTELQRVHGLWTNKNSMTARNGATTYTVAANEGTYVGSIFIDGSAGQVTCHRTWGQSRKWGVWNAFNRVPVYLKCGDSTASWTYTSTTIRQSDAASGNTLTVFSGLAENVFDLSFKQKLQYINVNATSANSGAQIGIGWNSTTAISGTAGAAVENYGQTATLASIMTQTVTAEYISPPSIGINNVNAVESALVNANAQTFFGTEANMSLTARWMA
ncbi:hypothetical protein [Bradyrhizobium sp.]|uniref:hypothetical protein n=1 Tax=Bradyrhizobium sp. TaxID=376 RepID=UPI002D3CDB20|nr:hypothetical protein [Bradyrhizobium sp.]HZR77345.1 hypothetical protein [Bradyrhizobium sp.]